MAEKRVRPCWSNVRVTAAIVPFTARARSSLRGAPLTEPSTNEGTNPERLSTASSSVAPSMLTATSVFAATLNELALRPTTSRCGPIA